MQVKKIHTQIHTKFTTYLAVVFEFQHLFMELPHKFTRKRKKLGTLITKWQLNILWNWVWIIPKIQLIFVILNYEWLFITFTQKNLWFKSFRITLVSHNWTQFCVTTLHMASCDWQRYGIGPYGDTLLPITTHHIISCDTKLCSIMW